MEIEVKTTWLATNCCVCGLPFASPVLTERLADGKSFRCPNGHEQSYTESHQQKAERLKSELARERNLRNAAEQSSFQRGRQLARLKAELRKGKSKR